MTLTTKEPQKFFVKTFFKTWIDQQPGLTLLETQILMYLCDNMDISNEVTFGSDEMDELAKSIGSTKRSIQSTFSKLLKRSPTLVTKIKYFNYMICPDLGIKNQEFDKIQLIFEAYERNDKSQAIEIKTSIFSKGKEKVLKKVKEELYTPDPSKFL